MALSLKRPMCFFDLETTGVKVATDRIVEISVFKVFPNGNKESKTWLVNPGVPIPQETSEIHGITDERVANEPTFNELAQTVYDLIKDSDLAGYNSNKFDIPLLAEEFLRAGIDFDMDKRKAVDVQNIFHRMEQRTLTAAYKFYCQKDLTNAHSAEADTMATYEILEAQIEKYEEINGDVEFLSEFSNRQRVVDFAGFIAYNKEDEEVFTFGKYKGRRVEDVFEENPGYYSWMQNADFPLYTKKILSQIRLRKIQG